MDSRKRNELLISINCSKAMNTENYEELIEIMGNKITKDPQTR